MSFMFVFTELLLFQEKLKLLFNNVAGVHAASLSAGPISRNSYGKKSEKEKMERNELCFNVHCQASFYTMDQTLKTSLQIN